MPKKPNETDPLCMLTQFFSLVGNSAISNLNLRLGRINFLHHLKHNMQQFQ